MGLGCRDNLRDDRAFAFRQMKNQYTGAQEIVCQLLMRNWLSRNNKIIKQDCFVL